MSIQKSCLSLVVCSAMLFIATPAYAGCSVTKLTNQINKLARAIERAERQVSYYIGKTKKEERCEAGIAKKIGKLEVKQTKLQQLPKSAGCFTGELDPASAVCVKAFNKDEKILQSIASAQNKDCTEKNKLQKQLRAAGRLEKLIKKSDDLAAKLLTCGGDLFDDLF